jgi:hypothetical protein
MEAKEIEEGNRMIMESSFAADHHKKWIEKLIKFEGKPDAAYKNAKYHSSFDWLMPVVEKIFDYRYPDYYGNRGKTDDDGPYDDCAYLRTFGMRDEEGNFMVRFNANQLHRGPVLIETLWTAVVAFIKDINLQAQSNDPK